MDLQIVFEEARTGNIDARNQIIESHIAFATALAKKYKRYFYHLSSEVESAALMGLCDGVNKALEKNCFEKIPGIVALCVKKSIYSTIANERTVPLKSDTYTSQVKSKSLLCQDRDYDLENLVCRDEECVLKCALNELLEPFNDVERNIITFLTENYTQQEIACLTNLRQQKISEIIADCKIKLLEICYG